MGNSLLTPVDTGFEMDDLRERRLDDLEDMAFKEFVVRQIVRKERGFALEVTCRSL
ncbi:MAG: hypothetical protein HGA54_04130 [Actinobacteria bacterium]|nr:hypothetical protein [Actinomycetota bacterium]